MTKAIISDIVWLGGGVISKEIEREQEVRERAILDEIGREYEKPTPWPPVEIGSRERMKNEMKKKDK
jgi:hypothetical protein